MSTTLVNNKVEMSLVHKFEEICLAHGLIELNFYNIHHIRTDKKIEKELKRFKRALDLLLHNRGIIEMVGGKINKGEYEGKLLDIARSAYRQYQSEINRVLTEIDFLNSLLDARKTFEEQDGTDA